MKVEVLVERKKSYEKVFHNLQKLELLFRNNHKMVETIDKKAKIYDMTVENVVTESRMILGEKIDELDRIIGSIEIPENLEDVLWPKI